MNTDYYLGMVFESHVTNTRSFCFAQNALTVSGGLQVRLKLSQDPGHRRRSAVGHHQDGGHGENPDHQIRP